MTRTLAETRRWVTNGTKGFADALLGLDADGLDAPSALPGWTRRHLVAHVAANAEALTNLVHWAHTGQPAPMYASAEQRAADIETGSRLPRHELLEWFERSAATLTAAIDGLPDGRWDAEVETAQGRIVPASEIPWLRAREVLVHRVDLDDGASFSDLPDAFLIALCDDIAHKRSTACNGPSLEVRATDADTVVSIEGSGTPLEIVGPLAAVTAYLAGRGDDVQTSDGSPVPDLPAWL